jgi:hypothetical protein
MFASAEPNSPRGRAAEPTRLSNVYTIDAAISVLIDLKEGEKQNVFVPLLA